MEPRKYYVAYDDDTEADVTESHAANVVLVGVGDIRPRQPSGHSKFENKTLRTRTCSVTPYLSRLLPATLRQPLPARRMTTETH